MAAARTCSTHAARHADIVGFTGLGRTLADGHRHAVRFQPAVLDAEVAVVGAAAAGRAVELNVLVQVVDVTDDREAAAAGWPADIDGLTVADALATPFLALGTHDEIAEHLRQAEARWGIGYVRRPRRRASRRSSRGCAPDHGRATSPDPAGSGGVTRG